MKVIFKCKKKLSDEEKQNFFQILKIVRPQGFVIEGEVNGFFHQPITFEIQDEGKITEIKEAMKEKNLSEKIEIEIKGKKGTCE